MSSGFPVTIVGPIYGYQWAHMDPKGHQIKLMIENIKKDPTSRRHLVTAWNPEDIPQMALPPCHYSFKVDIINDKIHGSFVMRSSDYMIGLPWNMAFYTLLFKIIGQQTGYPVERVNANILNLHMYKEHISSFQEQRSRTVLELPTVHITPREDIQKYTIDDFTLMEYEHHKRIKLEVAV